MENSRRVLSEEEQQEQAELLDLLLAAEPEKPVGGKRERFFLNEVTDEHGNQRTEIEEHAHAYPADVVSE